MTDNLALLTTRYTRMRQCKQEWLGANTQLINLTIIKFKCNGEIVSGTIGMIERK